MIKISIQDPFERVRGSRYRGRTRGTAQRLRYQGHGGKISVPNQSRMGLEKAYTNLIFQQQTQGVALINPLGYYIDNEAIQHERARKNNQNNAYLINNAHLVFNIGASHHMRIQSIGDLDAIVSGLTTLNDRTMIRLSKYKYDWQWESPKLFRVRFYISITEPGAGAFTPQDVSLASGTNIDSSVGAGFSSTEYSLIPIGELRGKRASGDGDSQYYFANHTLDMTPIMNEFCKVIEANIMTGIDNPEIDLLVAAIGVESNQVIEATGWREYNAYTVNR